MRPVWIDTDAGFDDLLAVQMVARAGEIEVGGISLVAGNCELAQVVDNAGRMAASFDWRFPIYAGASKPLAQDLETAAEILGRRGMRTAGRWFDENRKPLARQNAVDAIASWLGGLDQPASILALGPLTNLASFFRQHSDLKTRISELVIMGGSTDRGNATAVAEFNIYADPEAAAEVFAAGVALKMIGINVCRQVELVPTDVETVKASSGNRAQLLADLFAGYLSVRSGAGDDANKLQAMPLYDPTAAAALIKPEYLQFEPAHIAVELDGTLTRGMTVVEFRGPQKAQANALVGVGADGAAIRRMMFASLDVDGF
jgi:purine nucleosidase